MTAFAALRTFGRLAEGESVLIHAAAGGVGQAAVRLAKHFGARVFATASTGEKLNIARRLGADELINYAEQDFVAEVKARTGGRGVDPILESVGGETFVKNFAASVPFGRIVVYGVSAGRATVDNVSLLFHHPVHLIGLNMAILGMQRPDLFPQLIAEFMPLLTTGVVHPEEPTTFPLADGPRVLADLEQRKTVGKLVLVP
jgi:NADPH2:quinone reductase